VRRLEKIKEKGYKAGVPGGWRAIRLGGREARKL